jgi:hypothetical protein
MHLHIELRINNHLAQSLDKGIFFHLLIDFERDVSQLGPVDVAADFLVVLEKEAHICVKNFFGVNRLLDLVRLESGYQVVVLRIQLPN